MNKEYKIKLDLNKKIYNKKMTFNQFDENVNDFYIEVTKNNEVVKDLDKSIITLVAIKPNGTVDAQFIEVKEGQIYADLKPSMCDLVGNYQAKAMIVLEGEIVTTDTINYSVNEDKIISRLNEDVVSDERFTLFTDALARLSTIEISEEQRMINEADRILSEENRKIEEAKRVEAELIRQHEEADRTKYDAIRESNENIRKQNESIRLANETNRIDEEAKRVEEENKRKLAEEERNANYDFMTEDEERRRSEANAHKEAEALRVQAETNRVNEEAKRRTTEQARVSAENTRVSNENTREANEEARQNNETKRVEAETQRQSRYNSFIVDAEANANNFENYTNNAKVKEEERKANELDRKLQEDRRVSNEVERISNENTRKANEVVREKNETSRQNIFENKVDEVDKKIIEINTTKDNFVSSINTKVDTKISELNTTKDNFVSSVNTKVDSKISELDNTKSDMTTTVTNKVNEVETRFNALTSSQQQSSEVIDARDGETSLKARLDRDIEKAKQVYVNVEGSNISTDSSVGYLKDVEILGNTIQDASNLADIRSVGDKVEGQELYEIPVVSCGKNLFNIDNISSNIISKSNDTYEIRTNTPVDLYDKGIFKAVKNVQYTVSYKAKLGTATNFRVDFVYTDGSFQQFSYCNSTTEFIQVTKTSDKNKQLDYVRFNWTNAGTIYIKDIQIEEGTQATPYEPYQEDKLTILSPVQLEKVGDVRDRIIEKDGVWGVEKNISKGIINGSESWTLRKTSNENTIMIDTGTNVLFEDSAPLNNDTKSYISNRLVSYTANELWTKDVEGIDIKSDGVIHIRLSRTKATDLASAKEWLSNNNIELYYITTQSQFIPLPHDQQVKLRTFANKTNISFLTEVEGTIKAQVPKSLGATVNTHTEQINNLNKELDRVKKLEESTVSTVTTESDFTTVEATNGGYFEDVKLEGRTLVNLNKPSLITLTDNILRSSTPLMLKPNTTYTIVTDCANKKEGTLWTIQRSDGTLSIVGGYKKDNVYKFTTGQYEDYCLYLYNPNSPIKDDKDLLKNNIILEGDHTQNPPSFFEGLKSVGDGADEIVVSSVKGDGNLFDTSNIVQGCTEYKDNTLSVKPSNHISIVEHIRVVPDKTYYITPNNITWMITFLDCNKKWIGSSVKNPIEIPKDCYYVKIRTFDEYPGEFEFYSKNICFTDKADFTAFKHQSDKKRLLYYNNETQTWEKPILREWDSIEKHADGKYYYHVNTRYKRVTANDVTALVLSNDSSLIRFSILNTSNPKPPSVKKPTLVCGQFQTKDRDELYNFNAGEGVSQFSGTGQPFMVLSASKVGGTTLDKVKEYVTNNVIDFIVPTNSEEIYECTNIDLITYANETNYIVESGAIAPKSVLKVHNNISNVVSLLQKKVSLLESNITSYMITQNRLMLASRYNADTVSFKVDVASYNNSFEYDNDLYELILNNILVGKDNYNRDYIENLIIFYWMDFVISDEMYLTLFEIIEEQHNPKVIEEEAPIEE